MAPKHFYFDDNQFSLGGLFKRPVYLIAGFLIGADKERELEEEIVLVKKKYELDRRHPVKWNLRDTSLKKYYKNIDEDKKYAILVRNSDNIRGDILDLLSKEELGITLFMSGIIQRKRIDKMREKKKNKKKYGSGIFYQRCFTNLLQRICMEVDIAGGQHSVFLDFFKEDATGIANCYSSGFHFGEDPEGNEYSAGTLEERGFSQSLYFGKTIYNQFLQFADLITGCSKCFLEYCLLGKDSGAFRLLFPKIMDFFRADRNGNPFGRGIVISPREYLPDLKEGFERIREEREQVPF